MWSRFWYYGVFILNLFFNIAEIRAAVDLKLIQGNLIPSGQLWQATDLLDPKTRELKQQGLVVVFMSAKCPCSDSHRDELNALSDQYPTFNFLGVHSNRDEDLKVSDSYFSQAKMRFPVIEDQAASLADRLSAYKTPHAFILSRTGEVLFEGGVSDSNNGKQAKEFYLRQALEDLVQNRPVRKAFVRSLGCVISRGPNRL